MPGLSGCEKLDFSPTVTVAPDRSEASTPTGLDVDVHVPQSVATDPEELTELTVRDITLALPAGVALNPAGADGLEACSESQIGFAGFQELDAGGAGEPGVQTPIFTPSLPEPLEQGVNFCPDAAKVGTVKLRTPLLANPLEGAVYLAAQNANPFGSLVAAYVVAEEHASGVLVKLPGALTLDPSTGQISATFQNTPQLPFEDIDLDFFGGEQALLATPARCGSNTTDASLQPWSDNPPANVSSTFEITNGPDGTGCPGASLPFALSLRGGATNIDAGAFSALTATIGREDGQQSLASVSLTYPPGVAAILAGVPLCGQTQANAGTCGAASQVGQTTISAGLGGDPYTLTGGRVYLSEAYEGAPFGLSIVTPVKAGPLDLEDAPENHPPCDCVVVRAKVEVNPSSAQLTIATATIPSIIDGIPLQIRDLNLTIDRPGFIVNSTDCDPLRVTGTVTGGEGASAQVSSPFEVGDCAALKFTPKLTASTRANGEPVGHGASLHLAISTGAGPGSASGQANVRALKLDLPKQLPTRLSTLQKACRKPVFTANPANCPPSSVVGSATVSTPVLPGTMAGPVYFVSNGRESLPDIDIVLQGDGVRLNLRASTFVSAKNITSVTFASVPDIPLRSIELSLPEGKHSALGTETHLCKQKLAMPAALMGQDGAVVHVAVKVAVSGCAKARKVRRGKKRKGR